MTQDIDPKVENVFFEAAKGFVNDSKQLFGNLSQLKPLQPVLKALQSSEGRLDPLFDQIRVNGGEVERQIMQYPGLAAVGTALAIKLVRHEWLPHAVANAASLYQVFRGQAGLVSKTVLALEGYSAGVKGVQIASNAIEDTAATVSEMVSHLTKREKSQVEARVRKVKQQIEEEDLDVIDLHANGTTLYDLSKPQIEKLLATLDEQEIEYSFEDFDSVDDLFETPASRKKGETLKKMGGVAGAVTVYVAADALSKDIRLKRPKTDGKKVLSQNAAPV